MSYVEARNATKYFGSGETLVKAVDGMSFSIEEGTFAVILGPSGAGKTTLLNLLGGMDSLTGGDIYVGGLDLAGLSKRELTLYRRKDVGFVFQFYNLMPNLTARENVELATEICPDALDIDKTLEAVGLHERSRNFPAQLSGGEQQRVSIARAIAKNPKIMLCDEPTGALDYKTGKLVLGLLGSIARDRKKTVIVVTHNAAIADMADRVLKVKNGKIEENYVNEHPKSAEELEW